jgi:DNA-binding XRE family transcriptional regulator
MSPQQFAVRMDRIDAIIEDVSDLEAFLDEYLIGMEEIIASSFVPACPTATLRPARSEEEIARSVAERIKSARDAKGLRQQDLATITGIARPNIARLESGRRMPKINTLQKISEALGIHINELMEL